MECQQQIQKMGESRRKREQGDHGWLSVPDATDSHGKNEETSSDMLKNTPSNIRRLVDEIEQCEGRPKYFAQTTSPFDGGDVRWYFCKLPLADNGANNLLYFKTSI
ncbi:hypothetical protein CsSME_00034078 [Camellia sinensis var. sinensis]